MNENETYCKHCLEGIGRIEGQLGVLNETFKQATTTIVGAYMKIVYAMIGLVGASIGTKFIGTPWYIEMAMYATMFAAIFVGIITVAKRTCLSFWEKFIRYTFVAYCAYISVLRIYHYQVETPLTRLEGAGANLLITTLAVGFIMLAWTRDAARRNKKRRYDDPGR